MKKLIISGISVILLLYLHAMPMIPQTLAMSGETTIKVLLVYHPEYLKAAPHILAAYESVLQEEGVPYEKIDVFQLIDISTGDLAATAPVIIMPDNLLQNVPEKFNIWIKEYLAGGGNVAIIYDAGIKNEQGYYLNSSALADVVGLNYITYNTVGAGAYDVGKIKFASEASRDFWQIPFGKTEDRLLLSSYNYGALTYPIARNEPVRGISEDAVFAYGITEKNEKFPSIVLTDYARGKVLYVNLPLGYLKAYSDDLPLRSTLRTFLFDVVGIPHVMNVEQGRGGIVINWHVDSDIEHIALPYLLKKGYFRKEIAASFHITAGDFFLKPHDGQGFDAGGRGKRLAVRLMDYGVIGSHGGWAHNWFSGNIEQGVFKEKEIRENIAKNNECLEKITGYKIKEYAAPNGVHPPVVTKVLEELGVIAYYFTGSTGSGPHRAFNEGTMVSDKVIAFPIMPFGRSASMWEMRALDKKQDSEVREWLFSTLDYVARNRTVRLVYSHPYDIQHYPQVMQTFFDKIVTMQAGNELVARPMSDFAQFYLRFLKTTYTFHPDGNRLLISLKNPEDLAGITIALPKKTYKKPLAEGITVQEDERYFYLTVVEENEQEKHIMVDIQ